MTEHDTQLRELHEIINGLLKARIETHTAIIQSLEAAARRLRNVMYSSDRAVMQTQMSVVANALRDIAAELTRGLTDTAAIAAEAGCPICGRTETHTHGAES